MKKLLILSSLALLVAPSFSSNLVSNIAKEGGAFFDAVEGGAHLLK